MSNELVNAQRQFTPPSHEDMETAVQEFYAAASREAATRDQALMRALNRPPTVIKPELVLKQPCLPDGFQQGIADVNGRIYHGGLAVSRERLLVLGTERFAKLLAADRDARSVQHIIGTRTDLTDWSSVYYHCLICTGASDQVPVSPRKQYEELYGLNKEVDQIRGLDGFIDLWKVIGAQPQAVLRIYEFRDRFESLVFGQSMLQRLSDDGRLRTKLFCGGKTEKRYLFDDWLPALQGEHHRISLSTHSQAVIFWLAGERHQLPDSGKLAREIFNVRSVSASETGFATALFEGFLLGHSDLRLWEFVGRQTRRLPDQLLLKHWHDELNGRYRRVQLFHHDLERCFLKEVGDHYAVDLAAHRAFVDGTIARLRSLLAALAALAVEEVCPGTIVARFQDLLLCKQQPDASVSRKISDTLNAAFT
jgi:hypothetical protein